MSENTNLGRFGVWRRRKRPAVESAARALLAEMDRLTWGVPAEVDARQDLIWFSGPAWAETRRAAEVLREAVDDA